MPVDTGILFSIGPLSNRLLVAAVAVEALTLLAFVYVPPIQAALGQYPLSATQWLLVLITPGSCSRPRKHGKP